MHPSSVERLSEIFDDKVVTYLIFFVGTRWFQKCNFWKNSLGPFWGRRGRRGQTTSKFKTTKILNQNSSKIDDFQNLASATSKMASWPRWPRKGLSQFFQKIHFLTQGNALRKMSYSSAFLSHFENYQFLTLWPRGRQESVKNWYFSKFDEKAEL